MISSLLIVLAIIAGFTTHRANLCMVKAVIELVNYRGVSIFLSYLKMILWVLVFVLPIRWLTELEFEEINYSVTFASLFGGLIFGFGMAINGSCSFSTLSKPANGEVKMLLTLIGFGLGVVGWSILGSDYQGLSTGQSILKAPSHTLAWVFMIFLFIWGTYEIIRLYNSRNKTITKNQLLLSPIYRLSTSAFYIGSTGGILFILQGQWSYTSTIKTSIDNYLHPQLEFPVFQLILLVAILFGMWISSKQRNQFKWSFKIDSSWMSCLLGGLLMGIGGSMIPGGNDTLLLQSIPSFSPHGIPSFIAIVIGTALPIWMVKTITGKALKIECSGDVCQ